MNKTVKASAKKLEKLLIEHLDHSESINRCYELLKPIFIEIENGTIQLPLEDVPFGYEASDGQLCDIPALDNAYGEFAFDAKGYKLSLIARLLDKF